MKQNKEITLDDFEKDMSLQEFIQKGREVSQALDAKAPRLPHAHTFTSYEFEEFINELTPKRLELLRLAISGIRSISDLAGACHRDQSSVSKDVARLQSLGLVKVEVVANAGHGRKKLVTPVAETISINANFAIA